MAPKELLATTKPKLNTQSGFITVDFLFSFCLVFMLTIVLFALGLTLSVVEVTQYITFASARNYFAAHVSPLEQQQLAKRKYDELTSHPILAPLFRSGWYQLAGFEASTASDEKFQQEYGDVGARTTFSGVRVGLNAKILEIRIPFFGNTFEQEDGFTLRVSSFLAREPSQVECVDFNTRRFNALRELDPAYKTVTANAYVVMGDNGC